MPPSGPSIVILKKNSDVHTSTLPLDETESLYKRCGFKKPDGFRVHATWALPANDHTIFVKVFGKTEGRAGSENKSELPPPVDTTIFFGNMAIVAFMGSDPETAKPTDLNGERWEKLYELLIGGTKSLGGAAADKADVAVDVQLEEEYELDEGLLGLGKTPEGYAKDDFVVEDEDEDVDELESVDPKDADDDDDDDDDQDDSTDEDDMIGDDDDETDGEEEGEEDLDDDEEGGQRFRVSVKVKPLTKKGVRKTAKRKCKRGEELEDLGLTPPLPSVRAGDELMVEEYEYSSESEIDIEGEESEDVEMV